MTGRWPRLPWLHSGKGLLKPCRGLWSGRLHIARTGSALHHSCRARDPNHLKPARQSLCSATRNPLTVTQDGPCCVAQGKPGAGRAETQCSSDQMPRGLHHVLLSSELRKDGAWSTSRETRGSQGLAALGVLLEVDREDFASEPLCSFWSPCGLGPQRTLLAGRRSLPRAETPDCPRVDPAWALSSCPAAAAHRSPAPDRKEQRPARASGAEPCAKRTSKRGAQLRGPSHSENTEAQRGDVPAQGHAVWSRHRI